MDLNYRTNRLFPICVHSLTVDNFDQIQDVLIKESYDLRKIDPVGRQLSNRGGWQSELYAIDKSSETLQSVITKSLQGFTPIKNDVLMKVEGWTNINQPKNFNIKHNHPQCNFAGVFWIKVPDKSGNLIFESPHSFTSFAEINCYTDKFQKETRSYLSCVYEPLEGEIVIFPSFLSHCVSENESNEDRISYSFNIKLSYDA